MANDTAPPRRKEKEAETDIIEVETIDVEGVVDEDLVTWTKNKFRGFKRASPSTPAIEKTSPKPSVNKDKKNLSNNDETSSSSSSPSSVTPPPTSSENIATAGNQQFQSGRIQYRHFFSKFGKCFFEERTGAPCRFVHQPAPLCQSGTACRRNRCMYTHPNMAGRNNFLGKNTTPQMNMNPWPMMQQMNFRNPWNMNLPNPWNLNLPNPWNMNMNMAPQGNSMSGN